ncbi:MAG: phospholipid-binding protein MlaC [Candidatus Binatia bacterium]
MNAQAGDLLRKRRRVRGAAVLVALALLGVCCLRPASVPAEESPTVVVKRTSDRVITVLADQNLTAAQKRHKIQEIVYPYFDFKTLSRLVLARNWKRLTPAQQARFVEEFKQFLSMTYGKNVENYNNERIVVTGDRQEPGGDWTVKTKVIRPGASDFTLDYRLRRRNGRWRAIDVIIEGVSLVANYRSQFQEILSNHGPVRLINLLREKNANGETLQSEQSTKPVT